MLRPQDSAWRRPLGRTGLGVTAVGVGGAPLGSMPQNFGYEVDRDQAVEVVQAVLRSPIRFLDTANGYSDGESERRVGAGVAAAGGLPDDFLLATKVDPAGGDYSGDRVRASVAESRERLGVDHLPLVHLHDPENFPFEDLTAPGGAVGALVALRESGVVGSIGLAGGDVHVMRRYLDLGVFDALLVHNRLTLVDRSADEIVDEAASRGVGVVNAAIYGGGVLARQQPASAPMQYGYRPADPRTVAAVEAMRAVCERHGTDLPTAALQHSLRDERVASTVVGISKLERVDQALASAAAELPEQMWSELAELVPPRDAWLDFQEVPR